MKKLKKSMKIIISLASVFLVAVAAIVTVILVTKKRNNPPDEPAPAVYALTDSQKKLVNEIKTKNSTSISSAKFDVVKYSDTLPISASDVKYFDSSFIWKSENVIKTGNEGNITEAYIEYEAYVLNAAGESTEFLQFLYNKNIITETQKNNTLNSTSYDDREVIITDIVKNHVQFYVFNADSVDCYVATIKNHDISIDTKFSCQNINESNVKIYGLGYDFYVLLKKIDEKYFFKFYIYGSNIEKLSLEVSSNKVDKYSVIGNSLQDENENQIVLYSEENGIYLVDENSGIKTLNFEKGNIIETETLSDSNNAKASLRGDKYYVYSYKFVAADGTETAINIGDFCKLSSVYSGENYFGVFLQKVNASHELETAGMIVYYDYELNEILKYSATDLSSTIFYSDGTTVLTSEGYFAGKSSVELSKISSLFEQDSALMFDRDLPNGSFLVENDNNRYLIFNSKNEQICDLDFDSIVYFIDDNNIVFERMGNYYKFNLATNNCSKIGFNKLSGLDSRSPVYLIEENSKKTLYKGSSVLESDVESVSTSYVDNFITVKKEDNSTIVYYLTDSLSSGISGVSSDNQTTAEAETVELYAAGETTAEIYDYTDKVTYDTDKSLMTATHCITEGLYSKYTYFDFFEIAYDGGDNGYSGNGSAYRPLRIYYTVTVDSNHNPELKIISYGHHSIIAKTVNSDRRYDNNVYSYDGQYYYFGIAEDEDNLLVLDKSSWIYSYDYFGVYAYKGEDITFLSATSIVYGDSIQIALSFTIDRNWFCEINEGNSKFGYTSIGGDYYWKEDNGKMVAKITSKTNYYIVNTKNLDEDIYNSLKEEGMSYYYNKLYYQTVVIGIHDNTVNYKDLVSDETENVIINESKLTIIEKKPNNTLTIDLENGYKAYYPSRTFNINNNSSPIFFGQSLKQTIVGGKLIGITTLRNTDNQLKNKSLYNSSYGTYRDEMIEYRTSSPFTSDDSSDPTLPLSYLKTDAIGNYYIKINNTSAIYYSGGLNTYRFVYCIYEPITYYVEFDYNVSSSDSSDDTTIKNEIDYLQNYVGLTIGNSGTVDYKSFTNTWAYKLSGTAFKDATIAGGKYEPSDFTNDANRITTNASANNEYSTPVFYLCMENTYYKYVIIDGVKYYFFKYNSSNSSETADSGHFIGFGKFSDIETYYYFTSNESDYLSDEDGYQYQQGCDSLVLRIEDGKAYYHRKTNHTRTTNYNGHYYYEGTNLKENTDKTILYSITEKFSFSYTEDVVLTYNPTHIHYKFIGWKIVGGELDGKTILPESSTEENGEIKVTSVNINPYSEVVSGSTVLYYLAKAGISSSNPVKLKAIWEPIDCEINAVFNTVENDSGTYYYYGLTYNSDNAEALEKALNELATSGKTEAEIKEARKKLYLETYQLINDDKYTIASNKDHANGSPKYYKSTEKEDGSVEDVLVSWYDADITSSSYKIENESGVYINPIKFKYDPNLTYNDIYNYIVSAGLTSSLISVQNITQTFSSWAIENVNREAGEAQYVPIDKTNYPFSDEETIAEHILDSSTLTIYAYYSAALYKVYTKINPMGGATEETTKNNYSSTESSYDNSSIYNDDYDFAKITMVVTKNNETVNTTNKNYSNFGYNIKNAEGTITKAYDELVMKDGEYFYRRDFDSQFFVGGTIAFNIEETTNKYYLKKVVFSNIALYRDSGEIDKFTLTLYIDDAGKWTGSAVSETNSSVVLAVSIDSSGAFTIGSNTKNTEENKIQITESGNGCYIVVSKLSNPGRLNFSSQILGSDGTGFDMELFFEAYVFKNEVLDIDFEDDDDKKVDFEYNRMYMTSCQPLTNKEGKELSEGESAFVWLYSLKYLFKTNWTGTAATGYYYIYPSTSIQSDYRPEITYDDFLMQTLIPEDSMIIFYDDSTQMIYYPAQNTDKIYKENSTEITTNLMTYDSSSSEPGFLNKFESSLRNNAYNFCILLNGNYYSMGEIKISALHELNNKDKIIDYYKFTKVSDSTVSANLEKLGDGITNETVKYSKGCEYFYGRVYYKFSSTSIIAGIFGLGSYQVCVKFYNATYTEVNNDGVYTPAGNTRIIAIDPEQSRNYTSDNFNANFVNDSKFDLQYYISSISFGTSSSFSFDKITRNPKENSGNYYYYEDFKMNCQNASHITQNGRVIKYFNVTYEINDVYKLSLSDDPDSKGAITYYLFITKSKEDDFIRYFLIYDVPTEYYNGSKTKTASSYNITVKFKKLEEYLEVNVVEEDIYDTSAISISGNKYSYNASFDISYNKNIMAYDDNGEKNTDNAKGYFVSYGNEFYGNLDDKNKLAYTFYENSTNGSLLKNVTNRSSLTTLSWSSLTKFYPTSSTKYNISTKDGYIIKSISIYIGRYSTGDYTNLLTFEIDEDLSFDDLIYNSDGSYSYTSGNKDAVTTTLKYKVKSSAERAYGLSCLTSNKGLKFSNEKSTNWITYQYETYTIDQIMLIMSSVYSDVKIDITTTSYTEFIFENGASASASDGTANPLLKKTFTSTEDGKIYYNLGSLSTDTYLTFGTKDKDYNMLLDTKNSTDINITKDKYILRYYVSTSSNGIKYGSLRLIFYGTASVLKYGFEIIATTADHSVYFTNGRYYNEKNTDDRGIQEDAFKNLSNYAGRTFNDKIIDDNKTEGDQIRHKTNKMVYLSVGDSTKNPNISNYFKSYENRADFQSFANSFESNSKFFLATIAYPNQIDVETSSYLYNNNITTTATEAERKEIVSNKSIDYATKDDSNPLHYKFLNSDDYSRLYIGNGEYINTGNYNIYQLDNLNKKESWFNNTILSNISYSYYGGGYATWVQRDETNSNNSALTKIPMSGLNFSWTYYEILGYYLKYIMIEIADLETYYILDASNCRNQTYKDASEVEYSEYIFTIKSASGVTFKFMLKYSISSNGASGDYGYYSLYPVNEISDSFSESTLFDYVALMSNNIRVSFVSMAESYNIVYQNYTYGDEISTKDEIKYYETFGDKNTTLKAFPSKSQAQLTQSIFYDNMTQLQYSLTMDGYTFIGWGSCNYYINSDKSYSERYLKSTQADVASTWNTSSIWYDVSGYYFPDKSEKAKAIDDALKLSGYYNRYCSNTNDIPSGAFYVDGGFFVTDTGYKSIEGTQKPQNYNFLSDYIKQFGHKFGSEGNNFVNDIQTIYLYGLFKANTYLIQFDVNSDEDEKFYLDYDGNNQFDCAFKLNNTAFTYGVNTSISFYVTFDTNNWYFSGGTQNLMYSYKGSPYTTGDVVDKDNYNISTVVSDKFGYSWLGWWYKQNIDPINEGTEISSADKNTVVFGSSYLKDKYSYTLSSLIKFNIDFYETLDKNNSIFDSSFEKQSFVYKNQHNASNNYLSLDPNNGYVYFYDYSGEGVGNSFNNEFTINDVVFKFNAISDYLNTFKVTESGKIYYEEKDVQSKIVLSYYDTALGNGCYTYTKTRTDASGNNYYRVDLDKTNSANLRIIKLYANWVNNKYTLIFDELDNNGKAEQIGSSSANFQFGTAYDDNEDDVTFFFNQTTMQDYLLGKTHELPSRIGYDFVGWSFNYIINDDSLASQINIASSKLYLCSDLLKLYDAISGLAGTNDLESNVLMINGERLNEVNSGWILNAEGYAEKLGDGETNTTRYVYVFPVWKVQSFSTTISLNITKEDLLNAHEIDSNFALGLYKSAEHKDYVGISSKNYTFNNKNNTELYYNDIVANICFEIDFDQRFDDATVSFDGKSYKLADLFATSAGYYFLGLMYKNVKDSDSDYIVRNTLETVFTLNGLTHDNDDGGISYKKDPNDDTYALKFDINSYDYLYRTKFVSGTQQAKDTVSSTNDNYVKLSNINSQVPSGLHSLKASTNFGYLTAKVYEYNKSIDGLSLSEQTRNLYIMSEESADGNYYLYILHNNVKYYVVYYVASSTGNTYTNCITFDRTFLYYNEIKNDKFGAKYIIRFDTDGNAYYVDDGFSDNSIHYLNLKIALYTYRTNELYETANDGIIPYKVTDKRGTILTSISGYNYSLLLDSFSRTTVTVKLTNTTTREFTLYADWQKRKIETKVINGNNDGTQSNYNPGLAGYYEMKINSDTDNIHPENQNDKFIKSGKIDFYSDVYYSFLPFYNGRYISDMKFEFDTFKEETISGLTSFSMVHNTLILKFAWNSSDHLITISKITLNDTTLSLTDTLKTEAHDGYVDNKLNIAVLSVLDAFGMYNSTISPLKLYNYTTQSGTTSERTDYNQVSLQLINLMCNLDITCKYSVQTYNVNVYNVVINNRENIEAVDNGYKVSTFDSLESMRQKSNYYKENYQIYGEPYKSDVNYNTDTMSTISTDCAYNVVSYNVPYYYFITYSGDISGDSTLKPYNNYGTTYLFEGYYNNGSLSYPAIQQTNSLYKIAENMMNRGYIINSGDWYTYYTTESSSVVLKQYNQNAPVRENLDIYGMFVSKKSSAQILFYYWDDANNKYTQYTAINNEYTSGTENSKLIPNKGESGETISYSISTLPSSNYSPWQSNSNFVGFVYLKSTIFSQFKSSSSINERYNSLEYKTSNVYNQTSNDAYSAFGLELVDYEKDTSKLDGYNTGGYSSVLNYYYKNYIEKLSITDMFKHPLKIVDNKFYTKTSSKEIDGKYTKILDAVRVYIGITINDSDGDGEDDVVYIEKDLKMLNVETEILTSDTIYAIPIYSDMKFEIKSANIDDDTINLTTNTEMLTSNLFKINPSYTLFYDPKDIRIIVTNEEIDIANLDRNAIIKKLSSYNASTSTYSQFSLVQRGEVNGLKNYYGLFTYTVSEANKEYYVYYYYVDGSGVPVYYADNYIIMKKSSGKLSVRLSNEDSALGEDKEVAVETYISPLEFELKDEYLSLYNNAKSLINSTNALETVKTNRKLLIYIALQLMQSGYVEIVGNDTSDNFFYGTGLDYNLQPTYSDGGNYSITTLITQINSNYKLEGTKEERIDIVYTSPMGFYRMVYSLAYYFTTTRTINDGYGLYALYEQNNGRKNKTDSTTYRSLYDSIDTVFGFNLPMPGDLLKDDRTSKKSAIYNYADGSVSYVYNEETFVKMIMVLNCVKDGSKYTFQYLDTVALASGKKVMGMATFEYTYTDVSDSQNADKYSRFMLATGNLTALPASYNNYYGYDFQEAYIKSGTQNFSLTLKYGASELTTTYTLENCPNYVYKEVGGSETTIINLFGKYYSSSDAVTAQNNIVASVLAASKVYAQNKFNSYVSDTYPYTVDQVNNVENVAYTSQVAKAAANTEYSFINLGLDIIELLKSYYGYSEKYEEIYSLNYSTYYNRELQAYYNERYNEVINNVGSSSGSWYSSYIIWYKNRYNDTYNTNYNYKYYDLYDSLLQTKKNSVIAKYKEEMANNYATDSVVYNYIYTHQSDYNYANFKSNYIENYYYGSLTSSHANIYFALNDGTRLHSDEYETIKADYIKSLTTAVIANYIFQNKNKSEFSTFVTKVSEANSDEATASSIQTYIESYSEDEDVINVVNDAKESLGDNADNVIAYYISRQNTSTYQTITSNMLDYIFENATAESSKISKYKSTDYITYFNNAKNTVKSNYIATLTDTDVYNYKSAEEINNEAENNITSSEIQNIITESDNYAYGIIEDSAKNSKSDKEDFADEIAKNYKIDHDVSAQRVAESMVIHDTYEIVKESYLNARNEFMNGQTDTLNTYAKEYVDDNYQTAFKNELENGNYATYNLVTNTGTNYSYKSIVRTYSGSESIQCRIYKFEENKMYYNLKPSADYSSYTKTESTINAGYDDGNVWIFHKNESGEIVNIYTRFSSYFDPII